MKNPEIKDLSPFAQFCNDLGSEIIDKHNESANQFYYKGKRIWKWEMWDMGIRNTSDILDGKTNITVNRVKQQIDSWNHVKNV